MAKVEDFNFAKQSPEVVLFKDAVTFLVNQGKFQFQTVGAVPTFAGSKGEMTLYRNGTDGRLYIYMGTSWNVAATWTADAA